MTLLPRNNGLGTVQYEKTEGNQLFPVFLKLNNLHTVLIGAGNVGLEKLTAILSNSPQARVTVIAKEFFHGISSELYIILFLLLRFFYIWQTIATPLLFFARHLKFIGILSGHFPGIFSTQNLCCAIAWMNCAVNILISPIIIPSI